jgi:Copper amine oxidase N-terminal domain
MKRTVAMLALAAVASPKLLWAAGPPPNAHANGKPIAIVINGVTLPLDPPPRFEKNLLFVPVRRTIEALGLSFDRTGPRIMTQIGSKTVTLTLGSRIAQIDSEQLTLDAPMLEIDSVLYAPLRFFTDVLGAQAHFDRRSHSVTIVAQIVGRSSGGLIAIGSGFERFGTVAAVDVLSDPPTVTLEYNGGVKTIPIARNAVIDMQDVNANVTMPGELSDVLPGDFARVEMHKDGRVERVVDEYGSRHGDIVAIAGGQFVLNDGQVVTTGPTTGISLNAKAATLQDLRPSDEVTVRYNVETNEVREVLASRSVASSASGSGGVRITSLQSDTNRPLRPGDTVGVTLHATPGASATFDIGSDVTNQAMQEQTSGVYVGSYTIPRGANFENDPLIGRLTLGSVTVTATAPQLISASSVPPGISDFAPDEGATVNTNQPAVYASFAADAVPVNPSSALLWINGRDVTADCVRSPQFIQYLPSYAYPDGPVHVTVRVADQAGNSTTKSWDFTIRTH